MPKPLCFRVCANYRAEVAAILAHAGWADVTLQTYAPLCQNQLTPAQAGQTSRPPLRAECSQVCLVSGCLPMRAAEGAELDGKIHVVEQCFHLLAAPEWINQLLQNNTYLVSPGWLKHWPQHLAQWGFDQTTAQIFFHESMRQIVLLDTGLDPGSPAQAQALADYLALPVQIWNVGLSYLQKILQTLYSEWQTGQAQAKADRQTADYAVAFDWLPHLAALQTEQEVAEELTQFCTMLFAPRQASYRPLGHALANTEVQAYGLEMPEAALEAWLATAEPYAWTANGQGFLLRLTYQAETVGVMEISDLAFPAYREHYLKLTLALAPVGGLAIANARAYQAVQRLNAALEQRVDQRTAELRQANTALTRALRIKSEFMAAMSHELRTPLSGVMGMADTLQMGIYGPLTERQQKPLDLLRFNAQRLQNLVTDVLDYTALEAGPVPLHLSATPVQETCLASLQAIQATAQNKQIQLSFSQTPEITTVAADRPRLEQILIKLLDNAVKFTPKGGRVGLEVTGDPARQEVGFIVWDTGIGIALEDQAGIFEPFEQVDRRLAREHEGAGLGLALVQRLVELHGGRVAVDSAGPDQGSRFTVVLPSKTP